MNGDQPLALGVPVADKLLRTVVVYLAIALALRLAGKRDLAQLNSSTAAPGAERLQQRRHRLR
jgi:hypothetical protein